MAPFGTSILQHLLYESSTANRIARFGTFSNVTARLTNMLRRRFVQTRESTQAAISDTYNGDGKVYSALRAAAYVSWGIVTSLGAPSETGVRA